MNEILLRTSSQAHATRSIGHTPNHSIHVLSVGSFPQRRCERECKHRMHAPHACRHHMPGISEMQAAPSENTGTYITSRACVCKNHMSMCDAVQEREPLFVHVLQGHEVQGLWREHKTKKALRLIPNKDYRIRLVVRMNTPSANLARPHYQPHCVARIHDGRPFPQFTCMTAFPGKPASPPGAAACTQHASQRSV
jgi:hypothetical protein